MTTSVTSDIAAGYYRADDGSLRSIPWPEADSPERDFLFAHTLGGQVIDWAEGRTGEPGLVDYQSGRPWRFTDGQRRFLYLWYAFNEDGRWVYRSGVKRGAKGTGKDPFGAALCNIEFLGPSQIVSDGAGGFVGARHLMPLVQIAANSEDQSKDMLRVANAMWNGDAREYYRIDPAETRTILKDSGGRMEVLTASVKTAEGDPATFIALNESHHMTSASGGHRLAAVARRNVGKSPADLQARLCEFTNAHESGSDSEAERTFEAWQKQASGRFQHLKQDILYDSIEADPNLDFYDADDRMLALAQAYSDAPWADLERLSDEIIDPRTSPADSIRFYLNGLAVAEDAWVDAQNWDKLTGAEVPLADGDAVAVFLDCSKSEDATALMVCRLTDGFNFVGGVWERPRGARGEGFLVDRDLVDAAVTDIFDRFKVVWFGVDPSPARDDDSDSEYWAEMVDRWHQRYSRRLRVWASTQNSVAFDMRMSKPGGLQRNRLFTEQAEIVQRQIDDECVNGPLRHDGDPILRLHVSQAKRRANQFGFSLGKVSRDSTKTVDLAVALVGANLGRRLVMNSGKYRPGRKLTVSF